jgi:hypothetical protein
MAAYGRGQMLGSGINPESFKQDYSGFANAAAIEAQGIAGLGKNIGNTIREVSEIKQERRKVDALNKASAKAIDAALTLAKSYGITGAQETLQPFLAAAEDPNLSPIEKAALLSKGEAMIGNLFGRFDKREAMNLEKSAINARNIGGQSSADWQMGEIEEIYNGKRYKVPVAFNKRTRAMTRPDGTIVGQSASPLPSSFNPEDLSPEAIDAALGVAPSPSSGMGTAAGGSLGVLPDAETEESLAAAIAAANQLNTGEIDPSAIPVDTPVASTPPVATSPATTVDVPASSTASPVARAQSATPVPSFAVPVEEEETVPTGSEMTMEQYNNLIAQGRNVKGVPLTNGNVYVTDLQSYPPQQGTRTTVNRDGSIVTETIALDGKEDKAKRAEDYKVGKATELMKDLNLLESGVTEMAPGVAGAAGRMIAEQIPATLQAERKKIIDRVKATLTVKELQEMRNSSPTGASLGNISNTDVGLLLDSATLLSNALTPEAFKRELVRLKNLQHDVIYGSEQQLRENLQKGKITQSEFDESMRMKPSEFINDQGVVTSRSAPPTQKRVELAPEIQELQRQLEARIRELEAKKQAQ